MFDNVLNVLDDIHRTKAKEMARQALEIQKIMDENATCSHVMFIRPSDDKPEVVFYDEDKEGDI